MSCLPLSIQRFFCPKARLRQEAQPASQSEKLLSKAAQEFFRERADFLPKHITKRVDPYIPEF